MTRSTSRQYLGYYAALRFFRGDTPPAEVARSTKIPMQWLLTLRTGARDQAHLPRDWQLRRFAELWETTPLLVFNASVQAARERLRHVFKESPCLPSRSESSESPPSPTS